MNRSVSTPSNSFPLPSILLAVFVTLKLCGVISWPWLWVLAPLWVSLVLVFVVAFFVAVFVALAAPK